MNSPGVEKLCNIGDQHLANEQWEEADNLFQQALSRDAKSKRALLGRATCLRRSRYDYEQAQRLLNRCLYHYPHDPEVLTEQGWLYADQGDHESALVYFDQALSHDPTKREALQGKIRSLLMLGGMTDAHQLIESIAPNTSRSPWLLRELAYVYIAEGRYDEAVEAFLESGEPQALYSVLAKQADKARRDSLAAAIVARQGDNAQALNAVAEMYKDWYDLDAAIEAYTRVVQATPKDENANLQLIDLLRTQGRFAEAQEAYQNAVQSLGHTSDSLLIARAQIFFNSGQRDHGSEALAQVSDQDQLFSFLNDAREEDAIPAFGALIERQPNSTTLLKKAASRLVRAGHGTRALVLLEGTLEIDPNDIGAVVTKGEILLDQGRLKELDSLLKRGYSRFGEDRPELISLKIQFLLAHERYAEALLVAVSEDDIIHIQKHIDFLVTTGDVVKAEKLLDAAVSMYPDSIPFLEAQGGLLLKQRSYDEAAKVWNAIREKQPENINAFLQETLAFRAARRFEDAKQLIDQRMKRSHHHREKIYAESGILHLAQDQYEEAVQAFDASLEIDPSYWFAHLWKIRTLRLADRLKDAESAIKQALTVSYYYRSEITCEMGMLHEAREDWKAAAASYEDARRADDSLVLPYFLEANVLLRLNLNDQADRLVETILKKRGTENEVKAKAGWFYLEKKEFRRAETQFKEILSRAPLDFSAINGLGGLYFEQGKYELAEQKFRSALKIDQREPALWSNLAWAMVKQIGASDDSRESWLAEAEGYCQEAIELYPKYASAHQCLGIIAFKRGQLLKSEDLLKQAISLNPLEHDYTDLGALYAHLGRYEDAREVLEKGREISRFDAAVRVELGNVYLQMDRTNEAITVLKEACAINQQAAEPVHALAIALSYKGDLIEAIRVLRGAIRSRDQSGVPSLRVALCRMWTELADETDDSDYYAEALKEVRLAIAAQPKNPDVYLHAGAVCYKQQDYRAAYKHFKKCHELDSNNFEAEQNMRKLKAIRWQERSRARIGVWVGSTVGIICFALLIVLWWMYLDQPVPETKEAIRKISTAMLLTLSPILLALVFVALLLPWIHHLKLPGGIEAELAEPKEQISSGPTGPLMVSLGTSTISARLK